MFSRHSLNDFRRSFTFLFQWMVLATLIGTAAGSAVAFFLWLLEAATHLHWRFPSLLFLLPIAGLLSGWLYHIYGREAEGGNHLIIEQIHEPGDGVPALMAPLVLIGTLLSHVCGGSAGREGTAVQIGGSLASLLGRRLKLTPESTRTLLSSGMAAGFGAVFGTPVAGAIFAIEVPTIGRLSLPTFIPCLLAASVGDHVAQAWGTQHTPYSISSTLNSMAVLNFGPFALPLRFLLLACAGLLFGLAGRLFAELVHTVSQTLKSCVTRPWLRPVVGGMVVIALSVLTGSRDYLGLGVSASPQAPASITISSCFHGGGADWFSWLWKAVFTAVTVGSGFKGGEVTPLFFIGAALGHSLARLTGTPVDEMAALGFAAVFAGATNTPIASIVMALELFAPHSPNLLQSGFPVDVAIVCGCAWLFSGQKGIYKSQRAGYAKTPQDVLVP